MVDECHIIVDSKWCHIIVDFFMRTKQSFVTIDAEVSRHIELSSNISLRM